jgi:hypothetical protein
VRDLDGILAVAAEHGLHLAGQIPMPANTFCVILKRARA